MIRFIEAPLDIVFEEDNSSFKEEFNKLGAEMNDPIGQWIKLAKARGDTKETDPVLLELIVQLHRKVDELSALIKGEDKNLLKLKYSAKIEAINFDYFKLSENILKINQKYYGRIFLPVFPKREIAIYFEGIEANIAKITLMHDKDRKDYDSFIMARERAIIREIKAKQ